MMSVHWCSNCLRAINWTGKFRSFKSFKFHDIQNELRRDSGLCFSRFPSNFIYVFTGVSFDISISNFLQYAGNINIYCKIKKKQKKTRLLHEAPGRQEYSTIGAQQKRLFLNRSKTKVMTFSRKTQNTSFHCRILEDLLSPVNGITDIGVTVVLRLQCDEHVNRTAGASL